MANNNLRVLVVDDSALMRRMISDLLSPAHGFAVVGTARDGLEAVDKVILLRPEVVTMDVEMPRMNGLEAVQQIMLRCPTPIVMLSSLTRQGAQETLRSLALGAVDFVCKPSGSISMNIQEVQQMLRAKLHLAAKAKVASLPEIEVPRVSAAPLSPRPNSPANLVVVIGSSTGGPRALERILPRLPGDLSAGVVVAQHMPKGFTAAMAERLNSLSALRVREARDGDLVAAGEALIAPGGRHLLVDRKRRVYSSDDAPVWGVRPAVDLLMFSAAKVFGSDCLGVILTGMGQDGAQGLAAIRRAGGKSIAEDESTCVVYGMPKAAVEAGGVDLQLPLPEIPAAIVEMTQLEAAGRAPAHRLSAGDRP